MTVKKYTLTWFQSANLCFYSYISNFKSKRIMMELAHLLTSDLKMFALWFSTFCWLFWGTQASYLLRPASTHLLSGPFCSTAYWEAETAELKYSQMCVSTKTGQIRRVVKDRKTNLTALIGRGFTMSACVYVYACVVCMHVDVNSLSMYVLSCLTEGCGIAELD